MVYIKHWPSFHEQCLELHRRAPSKTRYLIKTRPSDSWLVLKVTNDETCLKYRTRSSIILNRFEAFTQQLSASMAGLEMQKETTAAAAGVVDATMEDAAGSAGAAESAGQTKDGGKGNKATGTGGAGAAGKGTGAENAAPTASSSSSKKKKKKGGKK